MISEVHFWTYDDIRIPEAYHGFRHAHYSIWNGIGRIDTTQMCLLEEGAAILAEGIRVFIHDLPQRDIVDLTLGKGARTDKEIRLEHNLYQM